MPYITGTEGADTIRGGSKVDYVSPGGGADDIDTGAGNDTVELVRDGAVDNVTLGSGADRLYLYYAERESGGGLAGMDRIRDFSTAQGDFLELPSGYGRVVDSGSVTRYFRWDGAVTTAGFSLAEGQRLGSNAAGFVDVRTWTNAGKTYLIIDMDGNGILGELDFVIQFDGAPVLTKTTFVADTFGPDTGTEGADTWTGTNGVDRYFGLGGNDTASAGGGGDELNGGAGSDRLNGDDGNDLLIGGFGSDILSGGAGNDKLYATSNGTDQSGDAGETEELNGGAGDDYLVGGSGRDTLDGGDGDDSISGAGGADILRGGAGNDIVSAWGDVADGGAGSDIIGIGEGGSVVTGGSGADEFQVRAGANEGNFNLARNRITDFNVAEGDFFNLNSPPYFFAPLVFRGALDNPSFSITLGVAYSDTDLGSDVTQLWTWKKSGVTYLMIDQDHDGRVSNADFIMEMTGDVTLTEAQFRSTNPWPAFLDLQGATTGDDVYVGTADANTYRGFSGDDRISGGGGDDTLMGGDGNDILDGGEDEDSLAGGFGDDAYYVDSPFDYIIEDEDAGTDVVFASVSYILDPDAYVENLNLTGSANINGTGNGLANVIRGNTGNNVLNGGAGADTLHGGKGADTYYVNSAEDQVFELKGQGEDLAYSSVSYTLAAGSYVETLVLTGTSNLNGTGNGAGNTLRGNDGNNTLNGGGAADVLIGGKGADTYYVDNKNDVLIEAKSEGTDTVFSSVTFELKAGVYIENLTLTGTSNLNATGNGLANVLTGNAGKNVLNGGAGADRLVGGGGKDTYYVDNSSDAVIEAKGKGTDWVYASASFSIEGQYVEYLTLTGSAAINATGNGIDNRLVGNAGDNKLNGLAGQDRLTGGGGVDTFVWDATSHSKVSKSDRITDLTNADFIDLSRIDADASAAGTQHFVLVDAFTNTAGQITLTFDGTHTRLNADTTGDGVSDMLIRIDGNHEDFNNFIFGGG